MLMDSTLQHSNVDASAEEQNAGNHVESEWTHIRVTEGDINMHFDCKERVIITAPHGRAKFPSGERYHC